MLHTAYIPHHNAAQPYIPHHNAAQPYIPHHNAAHSVERANSVMAFSRVWFDVKWERAHWVLDRDGPSPPRPKANTYIHTHIRTIVTCGKTNSVTRSTTPHKVAPTELYTVCTGQVWSWPDSVAAMVVPDSGGCETDHCWNCSHAGP